MSEIYAPGSIAGPQGPAGPAGSQGSVTALASSVLPAPGNLFDANKVVAGYAVQSDGTLAASANWASSGLIYCAGMTSMIANLPIDPQDATFALYDANGNFVSALASSYFGGAFLPGPGQLLGGSAFPLPGTQVYVRFSWIVPRMNGGYGTTDNLATAMVCASTGTASLPSSFVAFGWDTSSDVNAKDAVVATNAATALTNAIDNIGKGLGLFAHAMLPLPDGGGRNALDVHKVIGNTVINPDGTQQTCAGWSSALVFAAGATQFITNLPIRCQAISSGITASICTYDAFGNFIAEVGAAQGISGLVLPNHVYTLPGNQAYVGFTWNAGNYGWGPESNGQCFCPSDAAGMFVVGNATTPCPSSLPEGAPTCGSPFVNVKTATQLGAANDASVDCAALLNAFLATASSTNPVKLILDGVFLVSGVVISPNGYTTIEGLGWGSGLRLVAGGTQDVIRIGAYSGGDSEGVYNVAAPARTATNIILRDFTVDPNGQVNSSVPTYGVILTSCQNVHVENMNIKQGANYALTFSNAQYVTVTDCQFISTGTLHDGIHIDGPSSDIGISNCYFSTGDDSIALNAPEGYGGDISRVTVTNCRFNGSLSVMRIYTSIDPTHMPSNNVHKVRNVAVSNCVGYTSDSCFDLGIYGGSITTTSDADQVQDLIVSDCTLSSPNGLALITTTFGKITFKNVAFIPTSAAPVILAWYSIGELSLGDVTILRNPDGNAAPAALFSNIAGSSVDRLSLLHCRVVDAQGSSYGAMPCLLDIGGTVAALRVEGIDLTHVTALTSSAGWSGVTLVRGNGVLGTGVQVPDSVMDSNALYLSSNAGGAPSIKVGGTAKRLTLA